MNVIPRTRNNRQSSFPKAWKVVSPTRGELASMIHQLVGGLKSGMGYCGCESINDLQTKTRFIQITDASLKESHVHDVFITKEAPNYQKE